MVEADRILRNYLTSGESSFPWEIHSTNMKIYLFNDTSRSRHAGCKAVMRSLKAELSSFAEIVAIHSVGGKVVDADAFAACDAVVVNGEGTIHHDSPNANFLMMALAWAQAAGKKTALVNALYQQEGSAFSQVLGRLDLLTVREVRSAANARAQGGRPWVLPDSASDRAQLIAANPLKVVAGILKGGAHPKAPSATWLDTIDVPKLDMSVGSFDEIVATLKQVDVYVTGQHHGVYAAALAGIPFVALTSNSHKVEGLIEWSGLPIPVVTNEAGVKPAIDYALQNRDMFDAFAQFIASHDVVRANLMAEALKAR